MSGQTTLYSYAGSWLNASHSKTLGKTIKRTYLIKLLLLTFVLPFDVCFLFYIYLVRRKYSIFFATEKWPSLVNMVSKEVSAASISSPIFLLRRFELKSIYFPASIFYVPAALGLFLPESFHLRWSKLVVLGVKRILKNFSENKASIVVHSDALPFGRCLIMAANELGIKSVCIQHGSFRNENIIAEQDGFLCAHNIVRSVEDAGIICKANDKTKIHLLVDFFKLRVDKDKGRPIAPTVLLLGEGYHIIDENFNERYLAYLELIRGQLLKHNFNVVFRPHPSERNLRWNDKFPIVSRETLESCLSKVDAVIGYSSTLLQESAEVGILAFCVDPRDDGHHIMGRNGAVIHRYAGVEKINQEIEKRRKGGDDFEFIDKQPDLYWDVMRVLIE